MPDLITLDTIADDILNPRTTGIRVLAVLRKYERRLRKHFSDIFSTWEHADDSDIESDRRFADANPSVTVFTRDRIFGLLDEGFLRHDIMTRGFVPKTKRGVLRSVRGRGTKAYEDKSRAIPVDAREFIDTMWALNIDEFQRDIIDAITSGLLAEGEL